MRDKARITPADLSRDPKYRALLQASYQDPSILPIVSDYREELGLPRLAAGLAPAERYCGPADTVSQFERRKARVIEDFILGPRRAQREQQFANKHRELAVLVGECYHTLVVELYRSKRASVSYGPGGVEQLDWDAYGKRGYTNPRTGRKQPAKWRDAGARIVGYGKTARIVLENYLGAEVIRLPMPPAGTVDLASWLRQVMRMEGA